MEWKIHNLENLSAAFSAAKKLLDGGPLLVTVKGEKEQRRNSQNRLYWQVLTEISEQLGHGTDEVWHEYFKRKFLGVKEVILPDGQIHYAGLSSADLTVGDFTDYITSIEAWATERGVIFNVDNPT